MIEKIENYLKGNLNETEKSEFEIQIKQDAELQARVMEYKKVFGTLKTIAQREKLKKHFNNIHTTLPKEAKVVEMKSRFKLTPRDFAVAASVLVIMTLSLFLYFNLQHKQQSKYLMLKRDLDALKNSQHKLVQHINKRNQVVIPSKYGASAFMISSKGYLITSYHLIKEANSISVENSSGIILNAAVVFSDDKLDFSILKIADSAYKIDGVMPYGFKNESADIGEKVYTLGFPQENIVYEEGALSGRLGYRGDSSSYQISLPLNPGNSGGPLFDENGNIIGMIAGKQEGSDGVGFAIRIERILSSIKNAPKSTFDDKLNFKNQNKLKGLKRTKQLQKAEPFVYLVKVY